MHTIIDFLDPPKPKWKPDPLFFILFFIAMLFLFAVIVNMARCEEIIPPDNLWMGIIGEACSEGYNGLYAVACVYRNRLSKGMSLGCVALKRKDLNEFVRKQGRKIEYLAKRIIKEVFEGNAPDITGGASHYENVERFGIPRWAKDMVRTLKIKSHTFYKEK